MFFWNHLTFPSLYNQELPTVKYRFLDFIVKGRLKFSVLSKLKVYKRTLGLKTLVNSTLIPQKKKSLSTEVTSASFLYLFLLTYYGNVEAKPHDELFTKNIQFFAFNKLSKPKKQIAE